MAISGRIPLPERFWARVRKTKTCWIWTGSRNGKGYGIIWANGKSKPYLMAHRYAYELLRGHLPNRVLAIHKCDTPLCVRPHKKHVVPGTYRENSLDMYERGRRKILRFLGERNGNSKLTAKDVSIIRKASRGQLSTKLLSERFGVCTETVRRIIRGEYWR